MTNIDKSSKNVYYHARSALKEVKKIFLIFMLMMVILSSAYYASLTTPYLKNVTDRVYSFLNL